MPKLVKMAEIQPKDEINGQVTNDWIRGENLIMRYDLLVSAIDMNLVLSQSGHTTIYQLFYITNGRPS